MLTATVSTTDPDTGKALAVPPEHLRRAERVSQLLQEELAEVGTKFPVAVRLQFRERGSKLALELDLTTEWGDKGHAGVGDHALPLEALTDDSAIWSALSAPIRQFSRTLSQVVKSELAQIRRDLQLMLESD